MFQQTAYIVLAADGGVLTKGQSPGVGDGSRFCVKQSVYTAKGQATAACNYANERAKYNAQEDLQGRLPPAKFFNGCIRPHQGHLPFTVKEVQISVV